MKNMKIIITSILAFFTILMNVKAEETVKELFPDENFYNCIIKNNSVRTIEDLKLITSVDCSGENKPYDTRITNVTGVEYLTELTSLNLYQNNIESINLNNNTKLKYLQLGYNKLYEIDLSNNINLLEIALSGNQLYSIDLKNNTALERIYLHRNHLTKLNLTNNPKLTFVQVGSNYLESINVLNLKELKFLDVSNNNLNNLDLRDNIKLNELLANDNVISKIIFNENNELEYVSLYNNQLSGEYSNCFNSKKTCVFGKLLTIKIEDDIKYYNLKENSNIFDKMNETYNISSDTVLSVREITFSFNRDLKYIIIISLLCISAIVNIFLIVKNIKNGKKAKYKKA